MMIRFSPKKRLLTLTTCIAMALLANGCENSKEIAPDSTMNADKSVKTEPRAKNVILFIGDGMGVSTVTAGRIFDGQTKGMSGEENVLAFEEFENVALIKTYNTNAQVPDSAGTATAIMSGYKTNIGGVNVPPELINEKSPKTCDQAALPPTLAKLSAAAGKSVGVISTARLTHATPAAVYGHAASRGWESNTDLPEPIRAAGCESLSEQLVDAGSAVNLALGGGLSEFTEDQLTQWTSRGESHVVIKTGAAFKVLKPADAQDILGLFDDSHMDYEADRLEMGDEPSLSELTSFAIDNLSARASDGYVLMIEAGRIDHAHHGSNAYRALWDFQALNEAVKTAKAKAGEDTLILVTADHSHVFTMAGYPARGNPILGLVHSIDRETGKAETEPALAEDGKPYTTLGYHNGPNVREADSPALTAEMVQDKDYQQQTAVDMHSETHAGEDVPLYATGPGAEKVRGVMNQNEIHGVMMDAMGIKGN